MSDLQQATKNALSMRMADGADPLVDPMNAIQFVVDHLDAERAKIFLDAWVEGDVSDWPAYVEFVDGEWPE